MKFNEKPLVSPAGFKRISVILQSFLCTVSYEVLYQQYCVQVLELAL
jgi:hypothetical protein